MSHLTSWLPRAGSLSFSPVDLDAFVKRSWKNVPNTGYVQLSAWPADERNRYKDQAEVGKRRMAPSAAILPKGPDGKPKAGTVTLAGVPFQIGYPKALLAIPPGRQGWVEIPINQKLDWLFVLHAGAEVRKDWQAGYYRVIYTDGDSMNFSFIGELNCSDCAAEQPEASFGTERGTTSAIAWRGKCPAVRSKKICLIRWGWPNHRPDVEVTSLQVWRQPYGSQWAVIAVTAGTRE